MRPPFGTHPSYLPVAPAIMAPAAAPVAAPITVDFVLCPKIWPAIAPITAPVATFFPSLLASPLRTFSTCADTATTIYDTVIGIYTSSAGCGGSYAEVACNDSYDACAALSASLVAGTTYYVVVWEAYNDPPTPGETLVQLRVWSPAIQFLPGLTLSNSGFRLRFTGIPHQSYTLQTSTNLPVWTTIGTAVDLKDGTFEFNDTNAPNSSFRFYRVQGQ